MEKVRGIVQTRSYQEEVHCACVFPQQNRCSALKMAITDDFRSMIFTYFESLLCILHVTLPVIQKACSP